MKNRTILALIPVLAACTVMLGACGDNPSAPTPPTNQPVPSKGSSFTYQDMSYDAHGVISGSERTIASTLASTNATVNGRNDVLSFLNTDVENSTYSVESTYVATDAKRDVATVLDIFNGNDVYNPGPVWVTLPIGSRGTHKEVLSDLKNDDVRWVYAASSQYIGSESLKVGTERIATEHIKTILTITLSNEGHNQSFSYGVEWWYAPALHTFVKTMMTSEDDDWHTTRELTSYRLQ